MCILFIALNQHPSYPLVVAANRDEFYERRSQSMHYWPDHPHILAGRDEEKMGSWLGVNTDGKFCAVTNFRTGNIKENDKKSRGELITNYLRPDCDHDEFVSTLNETYNDYSPFNLVFGQRNSLDLFCSVNGEHKTITDGYHSISNGFLDDQWPKMGKGVLQLTKLVEKGSMIDASALNSILRDETKALDDQLPSTGASREFEKFASSIFIQGETYGTRTSTCLLFSSHKIEIQEINYLAQGELLETQQFLVKI